MNYVNAVTAALAAEITCRRAWDQPPGLYALGYLSGRGFLQRFAIPNRAWAVAPPELALTAIADFVAVNAGQFQDAAPAGLIGVAFFSEMWIATAPAGTAHAADLLQRARAVNGKVSKLPDRVEVRALCAVDRRGSTYVVFQRRGSDAVEAQVSPPGDGERSPGDGERFPGAITAITAALDTLVTALLGVSLPQRRRAW